MPSSRRYCLALLALMGVALLAPRPAAAVNDTYTVTDLGTLPGKANSWVAIQSTNSHGETVAYANDNPPNPNAFAGDVSYLWDNGKISLLPGLPGATDTIAFALNDNGVAVGLSGADGFSAVRAVVWEKGKVKDLGTYGSDPYAQAWNLNNCGQIVGFSYTVNPGLFGGQHAVMWEKGKVHLLAPLPASGDFPGGGGAESAFDINNKGQIVGASGPDPLVYGFINRPVLWPDHKSAPIDLGIWGTASAINDRGQIVMGGTVAANQSGAFLWENGKTTYLPTIGPGIYVVPSDINNKGQIVGVSLDDFSDVTHSTAILWENKLPIDLNLRIPFGSGWKLLAASGINERGQISGYGVHNGEFRAFLLTPRKK